MAQMKRNATRPTMKKRKKTPSKVSMKKVYLSIIGIIFVIFTLVSLFGSSNDNPGKNVNEFRRGVPIWYEKSGLLEIAAIDEYIEANKLSETDLQQLKNKQKNLVKIVKYEMYIPFSSAYATIQRQMNGSSELAQICGELLGFAMPVWEKLAETVNEPTDANLRELSAYMVSLKPDVRRLVEMIKDGPEALNKPIENISYKGETIRSLTIKNLDKLIETIDREKY